MNFLNIFKSFGKLIVKAFNAAKDAGLTDDLIQIALPYVREANKKFVDNAQRREWVVAILVARKVPESLSRLIVELAYQIYRKEAEKIIGK